MTAPKRGGRKRRLRECWVWWHASIPCQKRAAATKSKTTRGPGTICENHDNFGRSEWILMREVRRAKG